MTGPIHTHQVCKRCHAEKLVTEFRWQDRKNGTRKVTCRACQNIDRKRRREDLSVKEREREYRERRDHRKRLRAHDDIRTLALALPSESDRSWRDEARCAGTASDAFFSPLKGDVELVKAMYCSDCPVRQQCLEWAIEAREAFGVWGGLTPEERSKVAPSIRAAANREWF